MRLIIDFKSYTFYLNKTSSMDWTSRHTVELAVRRAVRRAVSQMHSECGEERR